MVTVFLMFQILFYILVSAADFEFYYNFAFDGDQAEIYSRTLLFNSGSKLVKKYRYYEDTNQLWDHTFPIATRQGIMFTEDGVLSKIFYCFMTTFFI